MAKSFTQIPKPSIKTLPKGQEIKKTKALKSNYTDLVANKGKEYADLHKRFADLGYEEEDAHKIASIVIGWKKGKKAKTMKMD